MFHVKVNFLRGACSLSLFSFAIIGCLYVSPAWSAPTAPIVYVSRDGTGDYNCDGTSDQLQINQALTYVINNTGFTTVHLKGPAIYVITDSVKIGSNTTLTGDPAAVIKLVDNANWNQGKPMVTSIGTGDHDITVCGFEIDGNDVNNYYVNEIERFRGQNWYTMLSFANVTRLSVNDMYLHDNMNDALKISSCSYVYYYDNVIHRHGHDGLYAYKCSYVYAHDNEITCRTNSGIRFSDSNHCEAYNNNISQADGGGAGIQIQRSNLGTIMNDIEIYNNRVYGTANQGLWLFGNEANVYTREKACNVYIHNNVFYDCDRGIQVSGFYDTLIENNVIDNCGWFGIGSYYDDFPPPAAGTGYNTTLRNNIITSNTYGVLNTLAGTHSFDSSYNCFHQNKTANLGGGSITSANELLDFDPLFFNKPSHDYHLKSQGGRWNGTHWILDAVSSPCIDAGDPASACANEPAPNGFQINMGADGNTTEASKSYSFRLTYTAGTNGTISGASPQTVVLGGNGTTVSAIPAPGYYLLRWSDGSKANPRVDLNVARNVNVTAIFAAYASLVWVQFNFTGVEDGTQSYPFNTLDEGVNAVTTGGTIRILSGSTATGGRIDKSLRLEAWNGTVTVGR